MGGGVSVFFHMYLFGWVVFPSSSLGVPSFPEKWLTSDGFLIKAEQIIMVDELT